ncbi:hypothetical protein E2C01_047714 [Portunus trituberculatus]|uniref:Uncharacterized protein n=1 Tax=Portunus trituberculatus TaxID=210409 RepID=A0A5B7G9A1_PORTR|nr:hypothetical protein [Portunus trituberculatus]
MKFVSKAASASQNGWPTPIHLLTLSSQLYSRHHLARGALAPPQPPAHLPCPAMPPCPCQAGITQPAASGPAGARRQAMNR